MNRHIHNIAADLTIRVTEHGEDVQISIPGVGQVLISVSQCRSLIYQLGETRRRIIARRKAELASELEHPANAMFLGDSA